MATTTTATTTASSTTTTTTPVGHDDEILSLDAQIDLLDRHGYLFGQKLAASMSPLLHGTVYRELGLQWEQFRLDSTDMNLFLRLMHHPKFYGSFPLPFTGMLSETD